MRGVEKSRDPSRALWDVLVMAHCPLVCYARPPTHAAVLLFSRSCTCHASDAASCTRAAHVSYLCGHIAVIAALVLLGDAAAQTRPLVQFHQQARFGRREHALRKRLHRRFRLAAEVLQLLAPPAQALAFSLVA